MDWDDLDLDSLLGEYTDDDADLQVEEDSSENDDQDEDVSQG